MMIRKKIIIHIKFFVGNNDFLKINNINLNKF